MTDLALRLLGGILLLIVGAVGKALSLSIAKAVINGWVWTYTTALPPKVRDSRRQEIKSDLWEQEDEASRAGSAVEVTAVRFLLRFVRGMPSDILWSLGKVHFGYRNPILNLVDYRWLSALSPLLMLGSIALLMAVLVPGIGLERNGAQRWIAVGPLPTLQPSEFVKLALIIYVAAWLSRKDAYVRSFALGFVPFVAMVGIVAGLILLQPDAASAIGIVLITGILFLKATHSLKDLVALALLGATSAALLMATSPHLEPDLILGGLQTEGEFGPGGKTGLAIMSSVTVVYALLVFLGIWLSRSVRLTFGSLLALGMSLSFAYQAIINLGWMTSMPPSHLASYSTSGQVWMLAHVAVMLSVWLTKTRQEHLLRQTG